MPFYENPEIPRTTSGNAPRLRRHVALAAVAMLGLVASFAPAAAQSGCSQAGKNIQCTEFGTILMDSQRDIRGEAIDLSASITLNTAYQDQSARWLMFSVRNVTDTGGSPVTISLVHFRTAHGDIVTTRVERPSPNEVNLWVDVLDTPLGTPIALDLRVGATERGAYRLETLVMAFDRGYAPVKDDSGGDASLFSFTLLGVNKETAAVDDDDGSLMQGKKLPGFPPLLLVASLALAVAAASRRRQP